MFVFFTVHSDVEGTSFLCGYFLKVTLMIWKATLWEMHPYKLIKLQLKDCDLSEVKYMVSFDDSASYNCFAVSGKFILSNSWRKWVSFEGWLGSLGGRVTSSVIPEWLGAAGLPPRASSGGSGIWLVRLLGGDPGLPGENISLSWPGIDSVSPGIS